MKLLCLISTILFTIDCFSQDLMQIAMKDKPVIVIDDAFLISEDMIHYINTSALEFKLDQAIISDFKLELRKQHISVWNQSDFIDRIVVKENEKIDKNRLNNFFKNLNSTQKLNLEIAVKNYNMDVQEWRKFPLKISKPIYSSSKDFAMIGFIFGNDGGQISVYNFQNEKWNFVGNLTKWAY